MTEPNPPPDEPEEETPVEAPAGPQEPTDAEAEEEGQATEGEPSEPPSEEPSDVQPEAAAQMSEREFERAAKKLDAAAKRWRAQVAEFVEATGQSLIANETDLDFCPGYVFHPQVRPLDEEQAQFARVLLGDPIEPAFVQDRDSHTCEDCDGWGRVKTGSKVAQQNVIRCRRCNGYGYISTHPYEQETPIAVNGGGEPANVVLSEQEQSGEDAWGTPRSHPDWGKSPQYRSPTWQADLAAYKAGEPAPIPAG
jgi:hypothetical protein